MTIEVIDPSDFLTRGLFRQDDFLARADSYNWTEFRDKRVLVRGCDSAVIPPWAFMYLTGKLAPLAKVVFFGNEHDHVVVFRKNRER